jgi:hypothetical protein
MNKRRGIEASKKATCFLCLDLRGLHTLDCCQTFLCTQCLFDIVRLPAGRGKCPCCRVVSTHLRARDFRAISKWKDSAGAPDYLDGSDGMPSEVDDNDDANYEEATSEEDDTETDNSFVVSDDDHESHVSLSPSSEAEDSQDDDDDESEATTVIISMQVRGRSIVVDEARVKKRARRD